jgi:hypothetical protein
MEERDKNTTATVKFLPRSESEQLLHDYFLKNRGVTTSFLEAAQAHHSYFALVESGCLDRDSLRRTAETSISDLISQIRNIVADSVDRGHYDPDTLGDLAHEAWAALKGFRFVGAPTGSVDRVSNVSSIEPPIVPPVAIEPPEAETEESGFFMPTGNWMNIEEPK